MLSYGRWRSRSSVSSIERAPWRTDSSSSLNLSSSVATSFARARRIVAPASRLRKREARADNDRTMRALPAPLVLWSLLLCGFVVLSVFAAAYDRFPADLWLVRRFQEVDYSVFAEALNWAADMVNGWELISVLA